MYRFSLSLTLFALTLSFYSSCKKQEQASNSVPNVKKEDLIGFYIIEPDIEKIRKASGIDSAGKPNPPGIACASINLDKNEMQFFLPLSNEKFSFQLEDEFVYKEYKNYQGPEPRGHLYFKLRSPDKSTEMSLNNEKEISGTFGAGIKTAEFAGKPIKSVEDCGIFPVKIRKECQEARQGTFFPRSTDGLELKSEASFDAETVAKIPFGSGFQIQSAQDKKDWAKATFKGKEGYVYHLNYDSAPICYDDNVSLQKIIEFSGLYSAIKFRLPTSTEYGDEEIIGQVINSGRGKSPTDIKNEIANDTFHFFSSNPLDDEKYVSFTSIQYKKEQVILNVDHVRHEYENPSNEYDRSSYSCLLRRDQLRVLSPWNPKINVESCIPK